MKRFIRYAGLALLALILGVGGFGPSFAQQAATKSVAAADDAPPQAKALLNLLADPALRAWLEKQMAASPAAPAAPEQESASASGFAAERLALIRDHVRELAAAAPRLPAELSEAINILVLDFEERGLIEIMLLVGGFIALGYGIEWLFYRLASGLEKRIVALRLDTVEERLRAVLIRLGYGLGLVAAFAVGSVGAFLALDWPPLLRDIVLGYLLAFLAVRLTLVAGRFLVAPGGERFRIIPMSTASASFWHKRVALLVGWFAFGRVTVQILGILGLPLPHRQLIAYLLGFGLLIIGCEAVWRRPNASIGGRWFSAHVRNAIVTAYFVLVWILWVASSQYLLWFAIVAVVLPAAIRTTQRAVNHILRPPGTTAESAVPTIYAVCLERGLRAAWIIAVAFLLVRVWHIDVADLTARDSAVNRMVHGVLSAVVIILIADFVWHLGKTWIDRTLYDANAHANADDEDARRRARLRTLLPILRNLMFIVLLVMSALMALAAIGIEIGPLVAGAGVVGVAVGFGAQTLVRDIISGMFFLLDDAFRVGEYIQSGNYKGTVESFSLRSVKLRHHRGPLYTVPFGTLGAVQNMSRDWVIDKMTVGVTYDSDLEKAKKLIKQIGKELVEDKELAPNIIETLKMQGVEQFGDYAIQIRMKMMTKPGEQFVIRRRAYGLLKKAFDANGIKFAFPTVQVAGGTDASGAVARQAMELAKPVAEA